MYTFTKAHPTRSEVLFHEVAKNDTEDYIAAPWVPTFEVEVRCFRKGPTMNSWIASEKGRGNMLLLTLFQTTASHTFTLKDKDDDGAVVRGCEFMVNPIEPIDFEVEGCPPLHTGSE